MIDADAKGADAKDLPSGYENLLCKLAPKYQTLVSVIQPTKEINAAFVNDRLSGYTTCKLIEAAL